MTAGFIILGTVGSVLGVWYALLGRRAIHHLYQADEMDEAVGWSLWWCLDLSRYDQEGRRLCKQGQVLAVAAMAAWTVGYLIQ